MVAAYKGKRRSEAPPHIYAVADNAYNDMLRSKGFLGSSPSPETLPLALGPPSLHLHCRPFDAAGHSSIVILSPQVGAGLQSEGPIPWSFPFPALGGGGAVPVPRLPRALHLWLVPHFG